MKIPFRRLLEALRFVSIETSDRKNVEARLLLREIEIWTELYQYLIYGSHLIPMFY